MGPRSATSAPRRPSDEQGTSDSSRKFTACVACRKRKIKCHMVSAQPPCTRCKARGLLCTVNKGMQTLLEDDLTWKGAITQRVEKLECFLASSSVADTAAISRQPDQSADDGDELHVQPEDSSGRQQEDAGAGLNLSCSLGSFPAASMNGATQDDSPRALSHYTAPVQSHTDPSSLQLRLLTGPRADGHFRFYQTNLDLFVHYVLGENETLAAVRSRSQLLATAICTVAAFSSEATDYDELLDLFKILVAGRMFSKQHSFDDVRALCIGSFWLGDMATSLSALAVRCSSELNLHRCVTKTPYTKHQCYERTRLYFLVYLMDHHCSLCYGRPPMTRELRCSKDGRALLQCRFSDLHRGDLSLISQVELWRNNADVFDTFGADIDRESFTFTENINRFQTLHQEWYKDWLPVLSPIGHLVVSKETTSFSGPQRAQVILDLYISAARLYLFSHVFRGPAQRAAQPPVLVYDRVDLHRFASLAIRCAFDHLNSLTSATVSGPDFGTLPAYLTTTATFASVFLLRVMQAQHTRISTPEEKTIYLQRISSLSEILEKVAHGDAAGVDSQPSRSLLLRKITNVLKRASTVDDSQEDLTEPNGPASEHQAVTPPRESHHDHDLNMHIPNSILNTNGFIDADMGDLLDFDFDFLDWQTPGWGGITTNAVDAILPEIPSGNGPTNY